MTGFLCLCFCYFYFCFQVSITWEASATVSCPTTPAATLSLSWWTLWTVSQNKSFLPEVAYLRYLVMAMRRVTSTPTDLHTVPGGTSWSSGPYNVLGLSVSLSLLYGSALLPQVSDPKLAILAGFPMATPSSSPHIWNFLFYFLALFSSQAFITVSTYILHVLCLAHLLLFIVIARTRGPTVSLSLLVALWHIGSRQ